VTHWRGAAKRPRLCQCVIPAQAGIARDSAVAVAVAAAFVPALAVEVTRNINDKSDSRLRGNDSLKAIPAFAGMKA